MEGLGIIGPVPFVPVQSPTVTGHSLSKSPWSLCYILKDHSFLFRDTVLSQVPERQTMLDFRPHLSWCDVLTCTILRWLSMLKGRDYLE